MNEQRDKSPNQDAEAAAHPRAGANPDTSGYLDVNLPGLPGNPFIESTPRLANLFRDGLDPDDASIGPATQTPKPPPPPR